MRVYLVVRNIIGDIDNTYSTRLFSKWILRIFLNLHILQQNITFQVLWLIYTDKIENIRSNLSYVEKSNLFLEKALAEIELDKRWKTFLPRVISFLFAITQTTCVRITICKKYLVICLCPLKHKFGKINFTTKTCT